MALEQRAFDRRRERNVKESEFRGDLAGRLLVVTRYHVSGPSVALTAVQRSSHLYQRLRSRISDEGDVALSVRPI